MLKALALPHQRPLQDDAALLVALALLGGKLVHPAQLAVAVLAADVSHHVSSCQHDSVLHLAVLQIDNLVEQESSAGGSSEACGDEFSSVGQDGVTVGAGEEASPTDMIQENPPHFVSQIMLAGRITAGREILVFLVLVSLSGSVLLSGGVSLFSCDL